jgi:PrcB C-terminal
MKNHARLAAALLLLSGCSDSAGIDNLWLGPGLREVYAAQVSGLVSQSRQVITDDASWAALWDSIQVVTSGGATLPPIDFATQEVIVASLGNKPTGGYLIHVDSLQDSGTSRTAFVTSLRPGPGCVVTTAFTQPVHVVETSATGTPIGFHEQSRTYDCE